MTEKLFTGTLGKNETKTKRKPNDASCSLSRRIRTTVMNRHDLSLVVRKPVFGVSNLVRHKPGCAVTEDGLRLEISDLGSRGIVGGIVLCSENKGADQLRGLICVFVFTYAKKKKNGFLMTRLILFDIKMI